MNRRTNNALVQSFAVNNRNELSSASRSGTLTVAGATGQRRGSDYGGYHGATNVAVSGTGLASGRAELYLDGSWARAGAAPANGANSYSAVASDFLGRTAQDTVTVNLPSTVTYTYDGNGNLTSDGSRTFEYDFENQLTNVYVSGQWRSEFGYDAMMRRRVRREYTWSGGAWVKTNEVRYVYDGRLVIQERDVNNLSLVTHTRGLDLSGSFEGAGGIGGLLARTDNQLTGVDAHAYYHFDGNGNVVSMINTNGTVVARYSYDPFGNILAKRGPLADVNLYRFSSKEYHPNSGLVYYLYRYYEPNLQRWVNRDPIGERGGVNLYAFAVNSPILAIDPYGLLCAGPELAAPALLSGESLAVGAATGASAGTAAIALAGAGPAPILVWALMNSVQAPTVYPDPLYTGVQNAVPVKVVCTLPDKSGKLRHRSDPGSKDDYTDAWEECSQRYRDYYNAEVWAQGTDNPEMECFDDFMDTCLEGLNFANDGPP